MKKAIIHTILVVLAMFSSLATFAQTQAENNPQPFKGYISNEEYQVYIRMNFYENNITVPDQEIFGELPGFFGANRDSRKWLFTSVEMTDKNQATITIINDYGSEDLVATLTCNNDSTYTLKQKEGSTLKIAVKGKWVKIPKTIIFKK
ncbi:MAG: hypothetical protein IKW98_13285 [Prevotella sp.]|nr:hypothetical protein [Prevotella sp.]